MKFNTTEEEVCKFVWRDTIATYDPKTKKLDFDPFNLDVVPFKEHPEDMFCFIVWIQNCCQHQKDVTFECMGKIENVQLYTEKLF